MKSLHGVKINMSLCDSAAQPQGEFLPVAELFPDSFRNLPGAAGCVTMIGVISTCRVTLAYGMRFLLWIVLLPLKLWTRSGRALSRMDIWSRNVLRQRVSRQPAPPPPRCKVLPFRRSHSA